jgi:hypothetical protein
MPPRRPERPRSLKWPRPQRPSLSRSQRRLKHQLHLRCRSRCSSAGLPRLRRRPARCRPRPPAAHHRRLLPGPLPAVRPRLRPARHPPPGPLRRLLRPGPRRRRAQRHSLRRHPGRRHRAQARPHHARFREHHARRLPARGRRGPRLPGPRPRRRARLRLRPRAIATGRTPRRVAKERNGCLAWMPGHPGNLPGHRPRAGRQHTFVPTARRQIVPQARRGMETTAKCRR